MKNWQAFALEHGHIGATVLNDTQMFFPKFYGEGLGVTLTRTNDGYEEACEDGKKQNFTTIKDWLGY